MEDLDVKAQNFPAIDTCFEDDWCDIKQDLHAIGACIEEDWCDIKQDFPGTDECPDGKDDFVLLESYNSMATMRNRSILEKIEDYFPPVKPTFDLDDSEDSIVKAANTKEMDAEVESEEDIIKKLIDSSFADNGISDEELISFLSNKTNISKIYLNNCRYLLPHFFENFGDELTYLEELELESTAISDAGVLNVFKKAPGLKKLKLRECKNLSSELFIGLENEISNLEELDAGSTAISDAGVLNILNKAPNVKTLNLYSCKNLSEKPFVNLDDELSYLEKFDVGLTAISDAGVLNVLKKAPMLKKLKLRMCKNLSSELFIGLENRISNLEKLDLTMTAITDAGALNILKKAPNIRKVSLFFCLKLSSKLFTDLDDELNNLEEIVFDRTAISDAGILNILKKAPKLRKLSLYNCRNLSPELFTTLEDTLSNLEELEAGLTAITDAGALNVLKIAPNLKKISLFFCENLSPELFTTLDDELSNLEELILDSTAISDVGVLNIFKKALKLKKLSLGKCMNLSPELFESLEYELNNLEEVELGLTAISDAGVLNILNKAPHLKKIKLTYCNNLSPELFTKIDAELNNLEELTLGFTSIADAGVLNILKKAPLLKVLFISNCSGLSQEIFEGLQDSTYSLEVLDLSSNRISTKSLQNIIKSSPKLKRVIIRSTSIYARNKLLKIQDGCIEIPPQKSLQEFLIRQYKTLNN